MHRLLETTEMSVSWICLHCHGKTASDNSATHMQLISLQAGCAQILVGKSYHTPTEYNSQVKVA